MTTAAEESVAVVVLGTIPGVDLPRYDDVEALPSRARLIVVECRPDWPESLIATLRRQNPRARIVAWLAQASEAMLKHCMQLGYDDFALGDTHLQHALVRWRREIELAERHDIEQEVHEGLVSLIAEINDRPELADVLCTAVLRMAQLFNIDRVSVVLFKPGDEVGFVVAEHEESLIENLVLRINDYPELQALMERPEPLVIPDVLGNALLSGVRTKLEQARAPPRASVLFPLTHKGEVVGALFLRDKEPLERVEERLMHMGRLIASVTSVAIGSALEHDTLVSEHRALRRKKKEADEKVAGLQQFSAFFSQAHDGIVVTDNDGAIRYANDAAGSILHVEPATLIGQRFIDRLSPHSHVLARRALRGDSVGDAYGYVDLLVPVDGEQELVISAAIRSLEQPPGVLVSFRDVTELREIETELRQTKEFLENLIQSSVDAIVAADISGRIILFNRAAEEYLGYSAREIVGKMHVSMIYPTGIARDIMRRLRSEAYGGRGRLEMTRSELIAKTGQLVPVNLTASIIYEGHQEMATVGIYTDLRERLKMEEKLSQVQRRLKTTERQAIAVELAGTAAHELNQPLTSILGYAEMLRRRIAKDDANRKPIDVIYRETERMALIVKKIGQITSYETKPYVGGSQILDLGSGQGAGEESDGSEADEDS
jgi:PAS domain S-box-containing protein